MMPYKAESIDFWNIKFKKSFKMRHNHNAANDLKQDITRRIATILRIYV
jgi:hypothetical protein